MRIKTAAVLFSGLMLIGLLGACAKTKVAAVTRPEWTQLASGAYTADSGKVFYAVGKSAGVRSATLLRAGADNQAKAQMDRMVFTYLSSLVQAAGISAKDEPGREMIAELSDFILKRARISDHRPSEEGFFLSLCRLELSSLKEGIQAFTGMDETLRKNMLDQADRVFAEFSARGF